MSTPYQAPDANLNISGMISCKGCGKEIHSSAATCPQCGFSRRSSRYKSKTSAALFAFFLGAFGAHRFYLGQWWGIFYLLFFLLYIPGIIAFIEFIYFLVCDTEKWDNKYNEGIPAGPQDKSNSAVTIVLILVGAFFFVSSLGIIAAVAIPAYHGYTIRAKVSEVFIEVNPVKTKFVDYYIENLNFPIHNTQLELDDPLLLANGNTLKITLNGLTVTLNNLSQGNDSPTIVFTPIQESVSSVSWECFGGTLENKFRPSICRN